MKSSGLGLIEFENWKKLTQNQQLTMHRLSKNWVLSTPLPLAGETTFTRMGF